ncbi:Peptidylprolyl isomerase OS=Stutzerimonas stutzeri OX=316 GN=CXK95_08985 PE=4 SV=1 [Stutzerimonas stutzeri]
MQAYAEQPAEWAHIWAGNNNALLSIFQHDSASVRKGLMVRCRPCGGWTIHCWSAPITSWW